MTKFLNAALSVSQALPAYLDGPLDRDYFDRDTLETLTTHYVETALSDRLPDLQLFQYATMLRDPRKAIQELAAAANIDAGPALIDAVLQATSFRAMKAKAADYAPVGGTGFWKSDAGFFDSATSRKWEGKLSPERVAQYENRMCMLVPDRSARNWLENGGT